VKTHFQNFARYNAWANEYLYDAVQTLSVEEVNRGISGFFHSVLGTLNHILVGDYLWMERLQGSGPKPASLDALLYENLDDLIHNRQQADQRLITLTDALTTDELNSHMDYKTSAGVQCHDLKSDVLTHIFNHQTHHRGQCHQMLSQLGKAPPPLDMIYYIRSKN